MILGRRLPNPSEAVRRAVKQARSELSTARCSGFDGMTERIRNAVMSSERFVVVLERIGRHGLRRGENAKALSPTDVQEAVQRVRGAVGELGGTTPEGFSDGYAAYTRSVQELAELAERVVECGVAHTDEDQLPSEWDTFRKPGRRERRNSQA